LIVRLNVVTLQQRFGELASFLCVLYYLFYHLLFFTMLWPGVGALYIRRRPRVRVVPIQSGGGQERGIRSGTVPTPLVVGLGAACQLAQQELEVTSFVISIDFFVN
jgi:hypothetical protein